MNYKKEIKGIKDSVIMQNITDDSIPFILFNLFSNTKHKFILYVAENNFDLELIKSEIKFYSNDIEIIEFPEWNTLPYDVNSPQLKIQTSRMEALYKLLNYKKLFKDKKVLFLISQKALLQKIINKKDFKFINLYKGQKITLDDIKNLLIENCYSSVDTCTSIGNYSVNNSNIDIITFDNQAYRIILKNNIIQEIKSFNPETQISLHSFKEILILPVKEVIFNEENIKNFKMNYSNYFDAQNQNDKLYQSISNDVFYDGCENWLPLFYKNELNTIFDYLPDNTIFTYLNVSIDNIKEYYEIVEKFYKTRLEEMSIKGDNISIYNPIQPELMYINIDMLFNNIEKYLSIIFDTQNKLSTGNILNMNFSEIPNFFENSKEIFKDLENFLNKK